MLPAYYEPEPLMIRAQTGRDIILIGSFCAILAENVSRNPSEGEEISEN